MFVSTSLLTGFINVKHIHENIRKMSALVRRNAERRGTF